LHPRKIAFSALTLLVGGRKVIWPVKTEWWDAGMVVSGSRCRFAYTQLMLLPLTISCSSKSRFILPS